MIREGFHDDPAAALAEVWRRMPWWAKRLLTVLDILVNWRLGGVLGQTISERLARLKREGRPEGIVGCQILDRYDPGHCDRILARLDRLEAMAVYNKIS